MLAKGGCSADRRHTCEEPDVVDNEVQPESVSQGRALGEVGQIGADAAQELSKEGFAAQD